MIDVRADELRIGDFLRGLGDEWNEIYKLHTVPSDIVATTIGDETFKTELNHLWQDPEGGFVPVTSLRLGDYLGGADGSIHRVNGLQYLGAGEYVKISCANHRYRMGKAVAHNVITY